MPANETVFLAMADCQAKTDESTEIMILSCAAETRQPQTRRWEQTEVIACANI